MKHLFIVNPVAGSTDKTSFVHEKAAECFAVREDKYEVYTTKAPMDARDEIVRQARLGETLRVYACGGDGTLNECVCGAVEAENVQLTVFPTGTGNDFIKTFGPDSHRFFELRELVDGDVRPIDLIRCNGRPCLNICSVGIDARIGTQVHKYSSLPLIGGATGYVVSTLVNLIKGIKQHVRISSCGGTVYDGDLTLACACNGRYYGGGFNPVPEARPDDGLIDFLIIPGVSRAKFICLVGQYAKGKYASYPQLIRHVKAQRMEIESEREIVINVDGEAMYAKRIDIGIQPGAVAFTFPSQMAFFVSQIEENKV